MRFPLIIGNWKLNGDKIAIVNFFKNIKKELVNIKNYQVAIAPPLVYLDHTKLCAKNTKFKLAAQNVDINIYGAFTGEISAKMLKDIGVTYVIIGHSERRIYHKENDAIIAKKIKVIKDVGLIPVLCIGEMLSEKMKGKTEEVCAHQMESVIKQYGINIIKDTVIAYEPVWAIGTGTPALANEVQETHKFIRSYLASKNPEIAANTIIQYGGSINDQNVKDFLMQPDIDGVLVGNASLQPNIFINIIKVAYNNYKCILN